MKIFCHRGKFGCTDIGQEFLRLEEVKGKNLANLLPENSEQSITQAFQDGYGVEIDVVMTKDKHIIVTHTNDLTKHSKDAHEGDLVSNKTIDEMAKMKTGLGGQTTPFLTYDKFINIFKKYENIYTNVEIKGTIQDKNSISEPKNPSLIEKLAKNTPKKVFERIIWSSFALSNIIKMKSIMPAANVAQLFCTDEHDGNKIYPDTDDAYLAFNINNLKMVLAKLPALNAVHPPINSLYNDEVIKFCSDNKLAIRPWVLGERNPDKNIEAKNNILNLLKIKKKYPNLEMDFITDFADEVVKLIK